MPIPTTYICPKCSYTEYESGQFSATGGTFTKIFDIQNQTVQTVVILLR